MPIHTDTQLEGRIIRNAMSVDSQPAFVTVTSFYRNTKNTSFNTKDLNYRNIQNFTMLIVNYPWFIFMSFVILNFPMSFTKKPTKWLNQLMKFAKSKVSQVVLLLDEEQLGVNCEIDNILRRMPRNFPRWEISFQEVQDKEIKDTSTIPSFNDLETTTLVIIISLSSNNYHLQRLRGTIDFINKLSQSRSRPKCLFILVQEIRNFTHEQLLRYMSSRNFLDVTLVELTKQQTTKKSHFLSTHEEVIRIHKYNPFTEIHDIEEYTANTKWFPDKTLNFQGTSMKVGIYHSPPHTNMILNATGHIVNAFGKDISITRALSQAMNFNIEWKLSNIPLWGLTSCDKEKNLGFQHDLIFNEIQYLAVEDNQVATCDQHYFEWSGCFYHEYVYLLIPNVLNEPVELYLQWDVHNVLIVISFFTFIWITSRFLAFEEQNWRVHNLLRIAIGLSAPCDPKKLAERIAFGCTLLMSLFLSPFIYSAFTSTILHIQQPKVHSLQDIISSNLKPIIPEAEFFYMYQFSEGHTRLLLDKTIRINMTFEDCVLLMLYDRNVACIVGEDTAKLAIQSYRDPCGRPLMKILDEKLETLIKCWIMEAGSPFVRRFNNLTLRMGEAGLISKWSQILVNTSRDTSGPSCDSKSSSVESLKLRRRILILLALGYLLSILAFVGEMFMSFMKNKDVNPLALLRLTNSRRKSDRDHAKVNRITVVERNACKGRMNQKRAE